MQIAIRSIGNSKGVVLPKPLLEQAGLGEDVIASLSLENGAIVLRKLPPPIRQGWAEEAKVIAAQSEDALLMGEFGNAADGELVW